MPGTFAHAYDSGDGFWYITTTGGTSGSPARFADMHDADKAGTSTLKAATNGARNISLTYAIRPADQRALLLTLIVASKTTETDYVHIAGTDAWGNAQTEVVDVSAGNGTYYTTKRFRTVNASGIDCCDHATDPDGGSVWANGTLRVDQPQWGLVWEFLENGWYEIDAALYFGDDVTSTYFLTKNEAIYMANIASYFDPMKIYNNATFAMGEIVSGDVPYGKNGSTLQVPKNWQPITSGKTGATLIIANSTVYNANTSGSASIAFYSGSVTVVNSVLKTYNLAAAVEFNSNLSYIYMDDLLIEALRLTLAKVPDFINNVRLRGAVRGIRVNVGGTMVVNNPDIVDATIADAHQTTSGSLYFRNPKYNIAIPLIDDPGNVGTIYEQYSVDIHVVDPAGNNLSGVTVTCTDQFDTQVFSVQTDVNGDIATQYVNWKRWATNAETLTTYSPHTFTLSHPDYPTLTLVDVTLDELIRWRIAMPSKAGASNRRTVFANPWQLVGGLH
jgi:hypothetical protein